MATRRGLLILGILLVFFGHLVPALAAPGGSGGHPPTYYVSLGTSLSVGIQPDATGQNQLTNEGYADQLYAQLHATRPTLRLVKLGCPGETTVTMISGGLCPYENGSQLAQAAEFLHAHRQFVSLVTIDLGANDIESCGSLGTGIDFDCVLGAFQAVGGNLPYIVGVLRAAAGPGVPIVAMNYYNPFLAGWLSLNPLDQAIALASQPVLGLFNAVLGGIYGAFGVPVADVAGAFFANEPLTPSDPTAAVLVCLWTWMCTPPGPNIHPNAIGYGVIAQAFLAVLPALP